jgi:serralysin
LVTLKNNGPITVSRMDKSLKVCIDRIAGAPPAPYVARQELHSMFRGMDDVSRMAVVFPKKWPAGRPITIRFLEGDAYVQEKVKKMAMDWTGYANIKLQFLNDKQDADIQIAFQQGAGSWSAIGIDANTADPGEATMNYGWLDDSTSDKEYSRVVKHEFGHAIGCIHEHQNPAGGIKWNKEAVYKALSGPPNNWDPQTIDHNLFERYNKNITQFTQLDPRSIMTYAIPSEWTIDGMSFGQDVFDLSDTDKEFIKKMYP